MSCFDKESIFYECKIFRLSPLTYPLKQSSNLLFISTIEILLFSMLLFEKFETENTFLVQCQETHYNIGNSRSIASCLISIVKQPSQFKSSNIFLHRCLNS